MNNDHEREKFKRLMEGFSLAVYANALGEMGKINSRKLMAEMSEGSKMSREYLEHHSSIETDGGAGLIHAKEQKRVLLDDVDIDWVFTEQETDVFRAMWVANMSMDSIAKELGRKKLEIGLLIIEQAELGEIQVR